MRIVLLGMLLITICCNFHPLMLFQARVRQKHISYVFVADNQLSLKTYMIKPYPGYISDLSQQILQLDIEMYGLPEH